ncbi:MAG: hypothetical protein ACOVNV_06075 [Pirellulaceae bacterium]
MNAETLRVSLQQACDPLPPPSQQVVRRFFRLAEEEGSLQLYLEQLLPTLCSLLHAPAGMVWLRAAASPDACFAIRHRMETLGWDDAMSKRHDRLVQIAWQQRQPMLVEPTSRRKSGEATPQWRLAFAPICHQQTPFAMLELVLAAKMPLMPGGGRGSRREGGREGPCYAGSGCQEYGWISRQVASTPRHQIRAPYAMHGESAG